MSTADSTASIASPKAKRWRWVVTILVLTLPLCAWGGFRTQLKIWNRTCRTATANRQWTDLEATARRWSFWAPGSAEPWLFLADAVQHQERYIEAAEYLGRVPPEQPQYVPTLVARCKLLFGPANLPFEGERCCLEILEKNPRVATAHELLIDFYTVTMQRTKLREKINTAIRLNQEPRDAYVYYFLIDSVRFNDGAPLSKLWLDSYPDNEILMTAEVLQTEDEPSTSSTTTESTEKEQAARKLLTRFPHNVNLLAYLIEEEMAKGQVDHVVELLAASPIEAEADQRFWRFKGWVHTAHSEYDQAEHAFRHAILMHPMDWLTMHRLAEVLRVRGNLAEVARLEGLVKRSHDLRARIRDLGSFRNVPTELLIDIGRLARDCGDSLIVQALTKHLRPLDPQSSNSPPQPKGK